MRTGHKRTTLLTMAAAAAAAAIVGLAVPAGAAPMAKKAVSGTEHFQAMTTSGTATTQGVIAWGVFTAPGVDHQTSGTADTFVFPGGSVKLTHTNGTGPVSQNPKTCLLTGTIHGTYKLTAGTGAFKGISGHGTYVATILGIFPKTKKGACSQSAAPVAWQQEISASGPVTLP